MIDRTFSCVSGIERIEVESGQPLRDINIRTTSVQIHFFLIISELRFQVRCNSVNK